MRQSRACVSLVLTVDVTTVLDSKHDGVVGLFVYAVKDSVGAAPSRVDPGKLAVQLPAYPGGVLKQGPGDELDDGCGYRLRQIRLDGPRSWRCHYQFEGAECHGRSRRTASIPRTTSPFR